MARAKSFLINGPQPRSRARQTRLNCRPRDPLDRGNFGDGESLELEHHERLSLDRWQCRQCRPHSLSSIPQLDLTIGTAIVGRFVSEKRNESLPEWALATSSVNAQDHLVKPWAKRAMVAKAAEFPAGSDDRIVEQIVSIGTVPTQTSGERPGLVVKGLEEGCQIRFGVHGVSVARPREGSLLVVTIGNAERSQKSAASRKKQTTRTVEASSALLRKCCD